MKKYSYVLIITMIIQILLVSGCANNYDKPSANNYDKPSVIKKITDNSGPSKVEYDFNGSNAEIDDDTIAIYNQNGIQIFDLKGNKVIKDIPVSKDYGIVGLDISGDIVTWSETDPKSIINNYSRDSGKEDSNIFIYNYKTNEQKQITTDTWTQSNPKIWNNYLIWQDNRDDTTKEYPGRWSLYLYDLTTGREKKITSTLASHATYNISDDKIIWEDDRNFKGTNGIRGGDNLPENNKDIYLYDIKTGMETAIATGQYMESNPDVNGEYIAWEDRNNNTLNADIVLYNLQSKERVYVTKDNFDQGTPHIYGEYVVWMDERRGTSTNDVMIDGKEPNSDILIYNIKNKSERILTGDGPQMQPSISSGWIAFILSSQVNPKVQVIKY